jgi:hypothetical protein
MKKLRSVRERRVLPITICCHEEVEEDSDTKLSLNGIQVSKRVGGGGGRGARGTLSGNTGT